MDLLVLPDGTIRAIYAEEIELDSLGHAVITRASHVEPDERGCWLADMSPVAGPVPGRSAGAVRPSRPSWPGS